MKNSTIFFSRAWLFALLCVLAPFGALFAAAPVVAIDFRTADTTMAESVDQGYALHFGDDVQIGKDGPTGKPFVHFSESEASTARINPRQMVSRVKGDEVAVSFWFRLDHYQKSTIAYGVSSKGEQIADVGSSTLGETPIQFSLPLEETDFGSTKLFSATEGVLETGVWHHVAFTYSMSKLRFTFWLDGFCQRDFIVKQDLPRPVKDLLTQPMAKGFAGSLADVRIWNTVPPDAELLAMDVSAAHAEAMANAYEKAAAEAPAFANAKPFRAWCAASAQKARALGTAKKADIREWMELQEGMLDLPYLGERLKELAASKAKPVLGDGPVLPISIYPYDPNKRLPWRLPYDGKSSGDIELAGARGEFEAASFMVYPFRDVKAFHIVPTLLTGPGGAKIPASAVDVRVVKCWFTTRWGWNTCGGGGREFGTLSPELVLHDDAFIKVDRPTRSNYIRCNYEDGDRYVCISEHGTSETVPVFDFNIEPIHDAATFRPLPLRERDLRQFFVTVKVPADAKAGRYTGALRFTEDGKDCGTLPFFFTVHPFSLPAAATQYNIDRPFFGTWMHHADISDKITGGSFSNAVRRLGNEYKNMAEHNMLHPWTLSFAPGLCADMTMVQLDLMKKAGLSMKPLFGNIPGVEIGWFLMNMDMAKYNGDISIETHRALYDERMAAFSNQVARALDKVEKALGHRDVYCYGWDEAGPGGVRREMPFFTLIRALGAKPFTTMATADLCAYAVGGDDVPASMGRTHAQNWHEGGATVTTYAAPFAGAENPELWRRNKGIRLYTSNFDGCNEYVWYEGYSVWNEFAFKSPQYKCFCVVYPTADGVVDTVEWEALREGFDDVRYLTLLRRLAREAMRSNDRDLVRLGRRATAWAKLIDSESVDLDEMRLTAADWIVRLQDKLGAKSVAIPEKVYR